MPGAPGRSARGEPIYRNGPNKLTQYSTESTTNLCTDRGTIYNSKLQINKQVLSHQTKQLCHRLPFLLGPDIDAGLCDKFGDQGNR